MNIKKNIILVYPKMGPSGSLVQHMPLSILYASVDTLKAGYDVHLIDVRLNPNSWEQDMLTAINEYTLCIGISVITGTPIKNALEITQWTRNQFPQLPIVWGGPHATFNALEILSEKAIDYVIKGYGSKPLSQLVEVFNHQSYQNLNKISGLAYRKNGSPYQVPPENCFEKINYNDIPYHLIKKNLNKYGQLDSDLKIFSIYSAMGCPYRCAFCSSPAQYKNMKKKYDPYSTQEVVDHIEFVYLTFKANYIYFIDDDSFVCLDRIDKIIDEINKRKIKVKLGFRGARINEIKKMSDDFLQKLATAGTDILHIGAESGSQKILDLIRKDCTIKDIIDVNKKLARHPEIKCAYNWIVGLPGETLEDLKQTRLLMLRLIKDNPNALIFIPNKFRPLPGTELFDIALQKGYQPPQHLDDWAKIEAESDYHPIWYTPEQIQHIRMMQVTSYFIDNKINKVETGKTFKYRFISCLASLYTPIARIRLKHGFSKLLFEHKIFNFAMKYFR